MVKLSSDVPAGSLLVWHPFARTMANTAFEASESTATFYDTDGTEVTEVPDNRTLNVSAYLEAGRTYAPVISAVRNEDGVGSSSGGCSACLSVMSLILCAIIFRKNSR